MIGATFNLVTTIIFGTLKDSSLQINSLPLKKCFNYRNVLQNCVNVLSKMALKKLSFFCQTAQICFKSHQHLVQVRIKIQYGETIDFQCLRLR